ncbi:MAG: hypothetical protein JWR10_3233 [Rubritepida sp.]|nr:hypothetical protein [Rubritepida sp.]
MPLEPKTVVTHDGWRRDAATHALAALNCQTISCRFDGILADLSRVLVATAVVPSRVAAG